MADTDYVDLDGDAPYADDAPSIDPQQELDDEILPVAPDGAPAAPGAPASAAQQAPAPADELAPLLARMPRGLRRAVQEGRLSPNQALVRHYSGFHNRVDQAERIRREGEGQQQELTRRTNLLLTRLADTLGIDVEALADTLDAGGGAALPSLEDAPVQHLAAKMDGVVATVAELRQREEARAEDQALDRHVGDVDNWHQEVRQAALEAEPAYLEAEAFVAESILERQRTLAGQAAVMQDTSYFDPELVGALQAGQLTIEEVIERTAIGRAYDHVAQIQLRYYRDNGDLAGHVLDIAARLGWRAPQQPPGAASDPAPQPPPPRRPSQRLDQHRRSLGAVAQQPTPAPRPRRAIDAQSILAMDGEQFDQVLRESSDPEGLFRELLRAAAVSA